MKVDEKSRFEVVIFYGLEFELSLKKIARSVFSVLLIPKQRPVRQPFVRQKSLLSVADCRISELP